MIGFTAFKTRKPRQFEYKPRYYDPEKEQREQRRKELGLDTEPRPEGQYKPGEYIRGNMRVRRGIGQRKTSKRSRPLILFGVLILLGIAVWWVLN